MPAIVLPKYVKYDAVKPSVAQLTQASITSAILYKSLGIGSTTILALAGVYGTVAFTANLITTIVLTDQWGRRKSVASRLSDQHGADCFA